MSSGFVSETELAEQRRMRQEEWEKVRQPGQPEEVPEEVYDHRSLFERLEEQKHKRELDYEEAHKLKNMIKGLDDDEVEFLDLVDRSKLEEEKRKSAEEAREMKNFREAVATLHEKHLEERITTEILQRPALPTSTSARSSQIRLLAGAVVRKRLVVCEEDESCKGEKKSRTSQNVESDDKSSVQDICISKHETCNDKDSLSMKRKDIENGEMENNVGLHCIGILPGLGSYPDSSCSDYSSDTDTELPATTGFDLLGRKITKVCRPKSANR